MLTDKEIFELIKETYPLEPNQEFVSETEKKLMKKAKRINKKKVVKRSSFAASGIVLFAITLSWLFLFGGKESAIHTINSFGENNIQAPFSGSESSIYIYHTHSKESFIPEINADAPQDANHNTLNITLIGDRLSQELEKRNISTIHNSSDFQNELVERGLPYEQSYSISREVLEQTLQDNNVNIAFDIHRDSNERMVTTQEISGVDYAKITFMVSSANENFEENQRFAEILHEKTEEMYPGLSSGISIFSSVNKDEQNNYNQDLLDQSVLLLIGGVENTLEEGYRTAEAFAEVIEQVVKK
ncbi:stage II sporulation protein P [Ornithinibacillus sp. L9]|uniref:Stage II sporulation protein P n=1 Tax=Ornithinibacillus caprae TaxID=2678566 RepID=A0A6N8FE16_9BACI|nr:stage II sporulation protein P [Ornithinibacillus caprae]MUK87912.1 stage II sporulation protein P [Ornithinibacillus caprae]